MRKVSALIGIVAAMALGGSAASAAWLIPTGVTASSDQGGGAPAIKTIDGSGLSAENAVATHANVSGFSDPNSWSNTFNDAAPTLTFDLGASYDLASVLLWNAGHTDTWSKTSAKGFTLWTSSTAAANDFVQYGSGLTLADGAGFLSGSAQTFTLNQSNVRRVMINIDHTPTSIQNVGNYGDEFYVRLGEVRFTGTAVPEPTSLGILGLGAMAMLRRKRLA